MKSNKILNVIGIYLIFIGFFSIAYSFFVRGNTGQVFWLCYISSILFGFGILKVKTNLLLAQVSIMTIPVIIWNIDFFFHLITNNPLWGITNYMFVPSNLIDRFVSLQHIYTIPVTLFSIYKLKDKKVFFSRILKIAFGEMILIFILVKLFTSPDENVNCVFRNCLPFEIPLFYEFIWFVAVFAGITAVLFVLLKIIKIKRS
ncbi:MAG: hypothetical protein Q7S56_00265 [Nanoarchaeota archaeon]|nr:hypothetical protein [Nanoarchaeota archaeon]